MNAVFNKTARYRCEQLNITRVNGETVTLSAAIKSQYLYLLHSEDPTIKQVILEEYIYSVDPSYFKDGFEFTKKIENIKKRLIFSHNQKGKISAIINMSELADKWQKFRDHDLSKDSLYKMLSEKHPAQAQDIIITGNKEFTSENSLATTLDKNLFFHILLRASVGDSLEDYSIKQYSQLFPELELNIQAVKTKVSEENGVATYELTGHLDRTFISEEELREKYDKFYKPMIKYSYSEFDYKYKITYSIDTTNCLLQAKVSLYEKIKNNFEVITEYSIRKIEL